MEIQSYFTGKQDVRKVILDLLDKATSKIQIAVAWFTEPMLFNKLIQMQAKGVSVELIITNHEFNKQSSNNYELINENGGLFAEIGNDEQLMHMKFCIIDFNTVISGSANWTKKAFNQNNEEITVVTGAPDRTKTYIEEFNRLKELAGIYKKIEKDISLSKIIKYFNLFKAFISIGETEKIYPYLYEIHESNEIKHIVNLLQVGEYQSAIIEIDNFIKENTQIVDISGLEKIHLKTQINLLGYQIEALEIEKSETEAKIEQFVHRYIIELNPILAKILKLKKKIYDKLREYGIKDNPYEDVEQEFKETQEQYEQELENDIQNLTEEENKSIKEMHREAVKFCHPDSPHCIYEDKQKASNIFNELTNAFKKNDIEKVKLIYNELKLGKQIEDVDSETELEYLRAKYETLKMKLSKLLEELKEIKLSEEYRTISQIDDWDEYFESQKEKLEKEYVELEKEYVK